MTTIDRIMRTAPVIPVLVIERLEHARPLAEALVSGGLHVLEVTLRTKVALDAIREMRSVDGAVVGAGTVKNADDLQRASDAGSEFIVSPGLTSTLARAAIDMNIPFLPGVSNAGDIMKGLDHGLTHFKFFPAVPSGGIPALKALSAPFGEVSFCPTGGITMGTAPDWLSLDQVLCVGGSWLVPKGSPDFPNIRGRAAMASNIGRYLD
ncbi:bifunctional 4-hydroxy-2-oxoglutarate aldolase/2-dehydro-3-deoxy-phosphogluconate aldolase [Pacificimonas flava]|uniref:bifunctional 4-hydroxy-2-oxoglutarate aldolase/2-dehydro-3-deoxy-phosphogluconate aldolase n=1 Tax=Pacificimonas flava TaxID=1234595 RepID=UPI00098F5EF1|nr:bifunctional 4-hydroxy-2-oxoglutarate aldolase/2-dehydro-3-deoxy-phosphogluconate aldolase [Pacificimonas flava]